MDRLQVELDRLYRPAPADSAHTRAMVLELARPADWGRLATVWQAVQTDLGLPAPAIAVSGRDGYQLWFSLAEPVPAWQAAQFLAALCARYLGDVAPARLGQTLLTDPPGTPTPPEVPALQAANGHWSAFVAPDLAALFADEPWLDLPPGRDAQADLLSRLTCARPADFAQACKTLGPGLGPGLGLAEAATPQPPAPGPQAAGLQEPRQFLLSVMNDPQVALHLRIEAARALLASDPALLRR